MNQENNKIERRRIGESVRQSAPPLSLDRKVTACLADEKAASDDIEHLSREVEKELAYAMRNLEQEKVLALNPNLDAETALHACKLAELQVERLRHSLQLLLQKQSQALTEEYHTRWLARQHTARQVRDQASARFSRVEALQNEIVDIYREALAADALVNEANSDAPISENDRLLLTEEHGRGLEDGFTRSRPSLIKETVLIGFDGQPMWPIKQRVAFYGDDQSYTSSEWWVRQGKERAQRMAELEQEKQKAYQDYYYGR